MLQTSDSYRTECTRLEHSVRDHKAANEQKEQRIIDLDNKMAKMQVTIDALEVEISTNQLSTRLISYTA